MPWQPRHPGRRRWSRARSDEPRRFRLAPPPTVLVVEDDDFGREALGQILEATGYRTLRASSAEAALSQMRGPTRPGLIVLDLIMPGLGGGGLVRLLRTDPTLAGIPIIVVSAEEEESEDSCAVVARFQKPVRVRELLAEIRRRLPEVRE